MTSHITLTGNLAADPVLRTNPSGQSRATFRVAVDSGDKEKGTEKTHWVGVTVFGALAENVVASLSKGMNVTVAGRIDSYDKEVVINGETVNLQILSVVGNQVGPNLRWQSAQVAKVARAAAAAPAQAPAQAPVQAAAAPAAVPAAAAVADDDF